MKVRTAHKQDAAALSEVAQRVFSEAYGANLNPAVLQQHLEQFLNPGVFYTEISQSKAHFIVCEAQESLAGFVKLEASPTACRRQAQPSETSTSGFPQPDEGNKAVEIAKFYIASSFQGTGVAAALMHSSLEWAKSQGFSVVWLLVWQENSRAVRFYQKHGFTVVGHQKVWVGNAVFDDFAMQRRLDD